MGGVHPEPDPDQTLEKSESDLFLFSFNIEDNYIMILNHNFGQ